MQGADPEWDIAISDAPAERLGEDPRIVVKIGRFPPRQIVNLSDMRCGVVENRCYRTRHVDRRDWRGLAGALGSANSSEARTPAAAS